MLGCVARKSIVGEAHACPTYDMNLARSPFAKQPGTGARRRSGGPDIIHKDDGFAHQFAICAGAKREGTLIQSDDAYPTAATTQTSGKTRAEVQAELNNALRQGNSPRIDNQYPQG